MSERRWADGHEIFKIGDYLKPRRRSVRLSDWHIDIIIDGLNALRYNRVNDDTWELEDDVLSALIHAEFEYNYRPEHDKEFFSLVSTEAESG